MIMDKKDNSIAKNNIVWINLIAITQAIFLIIMVISISNDNLSANHEQIIFLLVSVILGIIGLVGIIKGIIILLNKKAEKSIEDKNSCIKLIICSIIVIIINIICINITIKAIEQSTNDSWRCDPGPCENSTDY